jgi:hypothetical protein
MVISLEKPSNVGAIDWSTGPINAWGDEEEDEEISNWVTEVNNLKSQLVRMERALEVMRSKRRQRSNVDRAMAGGERRKRNAYDEELYKKNRVSKQGAAKSATRRWFSPKYFRILKQIPESSSACYLKAVVGSPLFIIQKKGHVKPSQGFEMVCKCSSSAGVKTVVDNKLVQKPKRKRRTKTKNKVVKEEYKPLPLIEKQARGAVVFGNKDVPTQSMGYIGQIKDGLPDAQIVFVGNFTVVSAHTVHSSKKPLKINYVDSTVKKGESIYKTATVKFQKAIKTKDQLGRPEDIYLFNKPPGVKSIEPRVIAPGTMVFVPFVEVNSENKWELNYSVSQFDGSGYHCSTFVGVCNAPVCTKVGEKLVVGGIHNMTDDKKNYPLLFTADVIQNFH